MWLGTEIGVDNRLEASGVKHGADVEDGSIAPEDS